MSAGPFDFAGRARVNWEKRFVVDETLVAS